MFGVSPWRHPQAGTGRPLVTPPVTTHSVCGLDPDPDPAWNPQGCFSVAPTDSVMPMLGYPLERSLPGDLRGTSPVGNGFSDVPKGSGPGPGLRPRLVPGMGLGPGPGSGVRAGVRAGVGVGDEVGFGDEVGVGDEVGAGPGVGAGTGAGASAGPRIGTKLRSMSCCALGRWSGFNAIMD